MGTNCYYCSFEIYVFSVSHVGSICIAMIIQRQSSVSQLANPMWRMSYCTRDANE